MELIWVCWFILGLVSGVIVSVFSVCKGEHDGHCNSVPDSPDNGGECDGMDRHIPSPEEIKEKKARILAMAKKLSAKIGAIMADKMYRLRIWLAYYTMPKHVRKHLIKALSYEIEELKREATEFFDQMNAELQEREDHEGHPEQTAKYSEQENFADPFS